MMNSIEREHYMQNFKLCHDKLSKPGQISVPFTNCDKDGFPMLHHGEIEFKRNFDALYKVDDVVIKKNGQLCTVVVKNEEIGTLQHIPNDYDTKNLRKIIFIATGTFANPILINLAVVILDQKVLITSCVDSPHNIELIEIGLSEIKKEK